MRHRMTSEDYSGLQIGHKIVWVSSDGPEVGEVKWIGVLPDARRQDDITVGVQFENPVGTGTGKYRGERLFTAKQNYASLIPLDGLIKYEDFYGQQDSTGVCLGHEQVDVYYRNNTEHQGRVTCQTATIPEDNSRHENYFDTCRAEVGRTYRRFLKVVCWVQFGLGFAQLVFGVLAVRFTVGQTNTFGPPYYVGAFIAGVLVFVAGLISYTLYRRTNTKQGSGQSEAKDIACHTCAEQGLCVATCMGAFIGIFFDAFSGLKHCDPNDFFSHCNYTDHMPENKTFAVFILILLLASISVSILVIYYTCKYGGSKFGMYGRRDRPLFMIGGNQSMAYQSTPHSPTVINTDYRHAHATGDITSNTGTSYSSPHTSNITFDTNRTIQELQEQNRLLQEQIHLQQHQLHLQQQQAALGPSVTTPIATSVVVSPPPSYDECMTDEAAIRWLEQHNQELQKQHQHQQQALEKHYPPPGPSLEPSAPPRQ